MKIENLIKLPTREELEKIVKDRFENSLKNVNELSFWYPKIEVIGFKTPMTLIKKLTFEEFKWLGSDSYSPEKIEEFNQNLNIFLDENHWDKTKDLFVKSGLCSNKFVFKFPYVKAEEIKEKLGEHALNVYYGGMCGELYSTEIVFREFLHTNVKEKIYIGMPLNEEYRVFYDFDKKQIIGIFNYWDPESMKKGLYGEDLITFSRYENVINERFERNKERVLMECKNNLPKADLTGRWSIDFMMVEDELYLIDCATAEKSYYYDKTKRDI